MSLIEQLLTNLLLFINSFVGNLGWTIIFFTILTKIITYPMSSKSIILQQKIRKIQPEINKLKKKHKNPKDLQKAQVDLYNKYNINPASGCLPQIIQLTILILLYRVLTNFLHLESQYQLNAIFFGLNLSQPDSTYILPILAGVTQFILSLMIAPGGETYDIIPNNSRKKKEREANAKEEDMAMMAQAMQKQLLFIAPVMTVMFSIKFPSGMVLYWVFSTILSLMQQYFLTGWGGLEIYAQRVYQYLHSQKRDKFKK